MELDEVADELYGLRPQEFTAARDDRARRARAAGQRELAAAIRALRRPTLAAWASNLLVRKQGGQVAPLLLLGEELRGAHRNLDGAELRALSHQQHQLVNALTEQAARLASDAGQPLGPQAQHEVAQTLHAVLADPDAAQEWAAGRLSKPLTATPGFEAAAREAASAPPARGRGAKAGAGAPTTARKGRGTRAGRQTETQTEPQKKTQTKTRKKSPKQTREEKAQRAKQAEEERKAARAAREAADEARRRRREADEASREKAAARAEREQAEERLGRLREEVREAEKARKQSRAREKKAEQADREARRRAEAAEAAEERARRKTGARGSGR